MAKWSWNGKVVWLTGASSGIGEAAALQLVAAGATLVASARREAQLEQVRARSSAPERVHVLPFDVSEVDQASELAARAQALAGPIDVLIHNAGIGQRSNVIDTAPETERRIMTVNFFGPVALTRAVLPGMIERRRGHIGVVSSVAGKVGVPARSTYCASKHALHGYFDALRAEVHDANVRVTILCPGFVRTGFSTTALTGDGSNYGVMDPGQKGGVSAERAAEVLLTALARGTQEAQVGGFEVAALYLKRAAPGLLSHVMRRARTR